MATPPGVCMLHARVWVIAIIVASNFRATIIEIAHRASWPPSRSWRSWRVGSGCRGAGRTPWALSQWASACVRSWKEMWLRRRDGKPARRSRKSPAANTWAALAGAAFASGRPISREGSRATIDSLSSRHGPRDGGGVRPAGGWRGFAPSAPVCLGDDRRQFALP